MNRSQKKLNRRKGDIVMNKSKQQKQKTKESQGYTPHKQVLYGILLILGLLFNIFFWIFQNSPMLISLSNLGTGFISAVVLSYFIDVINKNEKERCNKMIRASQLDSLSKCFRYFIEVLVFEYMKRRSLLFGNEYASNLLELEFNTLWEELETIESKCSENIKLITDNERTRSVLDSHYHINTHRCNLCRELEKLERPMVVFEAEGYFSRDEITCLKNARIEFNNVFISERKIEIKSIEKAFSILTQIPEMSSITKEKIYYDHGYAFITHNGELGTGIAGKQMDIANAIKYETRKKDELVLKTGKGSLFDYHDGIPK